MAHARADAGYAGFVMVRGGYESITILDATSAPLKDVPFDICKVAVAQAHMGPRKTGFRARTLKAGNAVAHCQKSTSMALCSPQVVAFHASISGIIGSQA